MKTEASTHWSEGRAYSIHVPAPPNGLGKMRKLRGSRSSGMPVLEAVASLVTDWAAREARRISTAATAQSVVESKVPSKSVVSEEAVLSTTDTDAMVPESTPWKTWPRLT